MYALLTYAKNFHYQRENLALINQTVPQISGLDKKNWYLSTP